MTFTLFSWVRFFIFAPKQIDQRDSNQQRMNFTQKVALVLLSSGIVAGCSSKMLKTPEKVSYNTEPKVLELKGDSVAFTMNLEFGPKFFDKRGTLVATPVLNYSGNSVELPAASFKGESAEATGRTVNYENGGKFSQPANIAFKKGMEKTELTAKVKVGVKKKTVDFPDVKLADGTIVTQQLLQNDFRPVASSSNFKEVTVNKEATIFFEINRYEVRNSEKKRAELQELVNFMQKGYEIRQIVVNGFASPDGELQLNDKLADQRAKAANDFVFNALYGKKGMKKDKEKLFDDNFYQEQTATEDWKGLLAAIQNATDIPEKDKVIAIINGAGSSEEKQDELRKLTSSYKVLADKYLPPLRRAKMIVKAVEPVKNDSTLVAMAVKGGSELTANEYVKAAEKATKYDDKITIYNNMIAAHASDYRSYNNLGVLSLQAGKNQEAKKYFEDAKAKDENASEVRNNLGIVTALSGDYKLAKDYFAQARNAGQRNDYNIAICAIRLGQWEEATGKMNEVDGNFNKALAFVLNKNYSAAERETDKIDEKSAAVYYLRAIIGARTDNRDMMTTGLTRAVAADAKFREMAKNDAEFIKHWNQDYFKVAIR